MKTLPVFLAAIILLALHSSAVAQDVSEMNIKDTDWAVVSVPKTAPKEGKVTAKIKIKGAGVAEDCELWVHFSKTVGTERTHNIAHKEKVALSAGKDAEHEVSFTAPADATAVTFTVFTMPTGKTEWSAKLQSVEVGSKVK